MAVRSDFDAVILDLDGVVTRTAAVHARAWKEMFDQYLRRREARGEGEFVEFDSEADYLQYVDGRPRYDGVRSFLRARGITLPEGDPADAPEAETVCGLGNWKNQLYNKFLTAGGVEVFDDAVQRIRGWRADGIKTAVVSSSKNCAAILETAALTDLFEVRVDGLDAERLGLEGKPAPDLFLVAARRLDVSPARAIVVEDALVGVEAGRAGGFGLVVGVDRSGIRASALRERGADVVVGDLLQFRIASREDNDEGRPARELPSALTAKVEIATRLGGKRLALFLDYDGTLTPIVSQPEYALLADDMRAVLKRLASLCTVAIMSGRDRGDVEGLVGLPELIYAGSHGFDIAGPRGLRLEYAGGVECLPHLDAAEAELEPFVASVPGARVERKRFAIAVHYRNVAEAKVSSVEAGVREILARHEGLRMSGGKKVFELRPDIDWDKGRAVIWLLEALGLDTEGVIPMYVGDDVTDEDAFRALHGRGLGVVVGEPPYPTRATYSLRDTDEVQRFLGELVNLLAAEQR